MAAEIVLLFVGRTGNGKSSTANSVIGEKFFSTGKVCNEKSVEQTKTVEVDGDKITVVDGTDIGDTGSDMNGDLQDTIQKAETAVQLCESGFNALIFVMTYGTRFTKQEKDAVDLIKSLFGRDIFRRFGIIVMTRGDQFDMDTEDDPKTFDQWCKEQTGDITNLFQECDKRRALFDNKTKDNQVLSRQRRDLLELVQRDKRYSVHEFTEAEKDRKDIWLLHGFPKTETEAKSFLENIDSKLQKMKLMQAVKDRIDLLSNCYDEVNAYERRVLEKYKDYSFAKGLLQNLSLKKMQLDMKRRNESVAMLDVVTDERTALLPKGSTVQACTAPNGPVSKVTLSRTCTGSSKSCCCILS